MNLVNLAFFISYGLVSIPAATLVRRIGYMKGATVGLVIMALGCFLSFRPPSLACFRFSCWRSSALAPGITLVQVVANPLISLLGPRRTTHSRLTFAQAFNSLGTTIFPPIGAIIILGSLAAADPSTLSGVALSAYRTAESQVVVNTYLGLAAAILIVAAVVWTRRNRLPARPGQGASMLHAFSLLRQPRFRMGRRMHLPLCRRGSGDRHDPR